MLCNDVRITGKTAIPFERRAARRGMSEEQPRQSDERTAQNADDAERGRLGEIHTAWQQAKDAFAKSERRYRDLVEHSLGLICTHDLTGRLQSINPAAVRSLGYETEHGVGHNLVEFLAPETRHLFAAYLQRIRNNRQDAGLMRVIARNGDERVWMYRNVLSEEPGGDPYVLGHAIDITERIAAERMLREKEHALRQAHDELERRVNERTVALEEANARLRIEIAERQRAEEWRERALIEQRDTLAFLAAVSEGLAPVLRFEQLVEVMRTLPVPFAADWTMVHILTEDDAIRSEPGIHLAPDLSALLTTLAAAASGALPTDSLVARAISTRRLTIATDRHDLGVGFFRLGKTVPLLQQLGIGSVAVLPLVGHGQQTAALSLGAAAADRFDGSGRIIVEELERRSRLTLDRIQLYREAQEANRLKDEFLSTLSHELRTPLNAVYGWARMLRMRELDGKTAHAVEVIERNAEAQIRLIEDVLDVSRIMTGKMTLAMESLDLRTILGATLDTVRPAIEANVTARCPSRRRCPAGFCGPAPAAAGVLECAVERRQVHRSRRPDYRDAAKGPRRRGGPDCRHGRRHSTRRVAVRVRSVPPGGLLHDPHARRTRPWPRHRSSGCRAARRNRQSRQPGRGARRNLHDLPTDRSSERGVDD